MQIQLKQSEIEAALKMFVAYQGINLANRDVVIGFTAGRSGTGISADLDIGDVHVAAQTSGGAIKGGCVNPQKAPADPELAYDPKDETDPVIKAEALEVDTSPAKVAVEACSVTSLFGS